MLPLMMPARPAGVIKNAPSPVKVTNVVALPSCRWRPATAMLRDTLPLIVVTCSNVKEAADSEMPLIDRPGKLVTTSLKNGPLGRFKVGCVTPPTEKVCKVGAVRVLRLKVNGVAARSEE